MSQGKFLAGLLREMSVDPTNLSVDVVPDNAKSSLVVSTIRSRPPSRQTSFCSSQAIQHQQKHHHTLSSNNNNSNGNDNCSSLVSYTNCDGVDKNGSILLPGSSSFSWSSSSSTSTTTVPPSSPPLPPLPSSVVAAKDKNPSVSHDAGKNVGGVGGGGGVGNSSSSGNTFEYNHRDVSASSPIMPISRLTLQSRKQRKLRERWGNGESSSMSSNSCCNSSGSSNIDGSAATARRTTTSNIGKALPQRSHRHQRKPTMSRSFSDITDQNIHPHDRILRKTVLPTSASSMPLSQPRRKLSLTEEEIQSMMLPLSSSASTDMNMDESLDVTVIEHRAPSDEEVGSDDDYDFSHTAEEELHDQRQSQARREAKEIVTVKMMSRFSQSDSCLTGTTSMSTTPRMPVRRRSIEPSDGNFDPSTDGNDGSDASINLDIINRAIHELTKHDE